MVRSSLPASENLHITGLMQLQQSSTYSITSSASASSLSAGCKPECLGGRDVDDQFELVYLFDRQISRLGAFENASNVIAAFVIAVAEHRSIAHEFTGFDKLTKFIKRRDCMSCCERDKVLTPAGEERIGADEQRIGTLLDDARENLIEIVFGDRTQDREPDDRGRAPRPARPASAARRRGS